MSARALVAVVVATALAAPAYGLPSDPSAPVPDGSARALGPDVQCVVILPRPMVRGAPGGDEYADMGMINYPDTGDTLEGGCLITVKKRGKK